MGIILALVIFSLIILFHELGHFLLAKKNGITVVEFSLGMGPRILSRDWHGTKYSWKLLPFGGSCMMLGEDEEAGTEGSFGSKSVWARISVIAAGPVFNFILAYVLSAVIVGAYGFDPAVVSEVSAGFPAQEAGIRAGDVITKLNGKRIHLAREVSNYITFHQGEDITVTYEQNGQTKAVSITPKENEQGRYVMGISVSGGYRKGNVLDALRYGAYEVRYWVDLTIESVKMLIRGQAGIKDMAGPVGVVDMIGETYTASAKVSTYAVFINLLNIAIFLSISLGVMNLLPIPALDGGRLIFLIIEAVRGKRVSPDKEAMVHFVGLMALMILMVVVMYNDVMRLF